MKSYTDLEQSRKLAGFLPHGSADMYYEDDISVEFGHGWHAQHIPCWSFAALFNVMPQINDWIIPYGHKDDKLSQFEPKICKIWDHSIIPSYKVTYSNGLSTDIYDNPVDAAFEMILKLHELGLL
jgi:hypothetical protein